MDSFEKQPEIMKNVNMSDLRAYSSKISVLLVQLSSALGMFLSLSSVSRLGYDVTYWVAGGSMFLNGILYYALCGNENKG